MPLHLPLVTQFKPGPGLKSEIAKTLRSAHLQGLHDVGLDDGAEQLQRQHAEGLLDLDAYIFDPHHEESHHARHRWRQPAAHPPEREGQEGEEDDEVPRRVPVPTPTISGVRGS